MLQAENALADVTESQKMLQLTYLTDKKSSSLFIRETKMLLLIYATGKIALAEITESHKMLQLIYLKDKNA